MDKKLEKELNEQVTKELFSAYLYLSMAAYLAAEGLGGMSHWMKKQAKEEVEHGMKIFEYLHDRNCHVTLGAFEKPESAFKSVRDVFEKALAHEKLVTASLNNIFAIARKVDDTATEMFMHWFIAEQVEEEKNDMDILTKLDYIKDSSMGLIMLDKELGSRGK